ncbi:MAG: hypothetical protein ACC726_02575, partial [Chloroflexota bacterium]
METVGGFVPFVTHLLRVPTFTLYADGLAVYRPAPRPGADIRIGTPLLQTHLGDDRIKELMKLALVTAGLADAREQYLVRGVRDAGTTVFSVKAGAVDKQVSVYALGHSEQGPDRAAYRDFEQLASVLTNFDAWLADDAEVVAYQPESYLGVFAEEDPERPALVPWPWDDLSPDDLEPLAEAPFFSTAALTPAQVELVTSVPSGGAADIGMLAADGDAYRLTIRPLLPDEGQDIQA